MSQVNAWVANEAGQALEPFRYELGKLGLEEVEVEVVYCGLCHTDLSFIDNEPGFVTFPLVAGHEVVGRVVRLGETAKSKGLEEGQWVGVGWNRASCLHCDPCLDGANHLCRELEGTIIGHHGGFASRMKVHWLWTIPLPEGLDPASSGPLFCAGITVFSPLVEFDVRPTDKVGVIGIGGLGHLALQFLHAWGCEVTAFSSNADKRKDILSLGADHVVTTHPGAEWDAIRGTFDLIIVTVGATLEWDAILQLLGPKGRLHIVGIPAEPIPLHVMSLLLPQASVSSSPAGARGSMARMLRFAEHHGIAPRTEHFPMSRINDAIAHLKSGKANYRVVLDADFPAA
ncbi:NAD(P)-dependent alcohol dehydrogenase [Luteibacter sp. 22Crub2.1]|uniref:NADPH-dependent aldehyde reductase Ahr n=1 Tax=Luteibacter sp. 22Crub2.1 TaxID=1283288 RepID=UPI0009A7FAF9|nr:NAD(P)-dependent alcohol dehydrogenase [Luteibacter sp. 22Crub2.1]SKB27525.1 uncharacterized zinc-type alcohol dehydrogenase-like protein [Luteibacter sp. 22Crub2.1]